MARLKIDQIEATEKTQIRVRLDPDFIDELVESINNRAAIPPIVVYAEEGSSRYVLADGFHRLAAARKCGRTEIGAKVLVGTPHDALHYALSANAEHGLRRTNADKRHAVKLALNDPEYSEWPLRDIGDLCRVSHTFVQNLKEEENLKEQEKEERRKNPGARTRDHSTNTTPKLRPTKAAPTQDDFDLRDLRQAMKIIKSFPYRGDVGMGKMAIDPDDEQDLKYVTTWFNEAVAELAFRHNKVPNR